MRMKIVIIFVLFYCGSALASLKKHDMRLERVAIVHYDHKYITGATSFTSRSKRGDTYKTNVTSILSYAWGSNVTVIIYYKNAENDVEHVLLSATICEALKLKWISDLTEKYSNIPTSCNVPPSTMTLERVIVNEQDPTAVRAVAFTYRSKRRESYKTNVTFILKKQWGNNVTFALYYRTSDNILLTTQVCGLMELKWFMNLVVRFSDIPKRCPMLADKEYHITSFELVPQNFPFHLPSGEHYLGVLFKQNNRKVLLNIRGTIQVQDY